MALESTAARMTSRTASNGVFRESQRLCPSRTVASVTRKTMIPRSEIWTKVKSLGSTPRPSKVSKEFQNAFIDYIVSWRAILRTREVGGGTRCPQRVARMQLGCLTLRLRRFPLSSSSGEADPPLARQTFAWHKTTLSRFSN